MEDGLRAQFPPFPPARSAFPQSPPPPIATMIKEGPEGTTAPAHGRPQGKLPQPSSLQEPNNPQSAAPQEKPPWEGRAGLGGRL